MVDCASQYLCGAVLLATGVTDLSAMAMIAIAITVERLAPKRRRAARAIGFLIMAAAILVIVRAVGSSR